MRSSRIAAICLILLGSVLQTTSLGQRASTFQLTSSDIRNAAFAPAQVLNSAAFGCSGANVSPQLAWTGVPAGTKSFVLTFYDPDAPTGSGWWHWIVINIPATSTSLPNGASKSPAKLPAGALETRTDFGTPGYGGPCPPVGQTHQYIFTLYALKVDKLDLSADSSAAMVGFMAGTNSLGKATITLRHGR